MIVLSVLTAAVLAVARPATDTTLTVKSGTRLSLENYMGSVTIEAWPRDAVRVHAEHHRSTELSIDVSPGSLELGAEGHWGTPGSVDWHITVPAWMAVSVQGVGTDISAAGLQGELKLETVKGDINVTRCKSVEANSVEGAVVVGGCGGRVDAASVNEGVRIRGCNGELKAESVNGDVILEDSPSPDVEASSVNGAVMSAGPFRDGGSYSFSAHNGDVVVALSEKTSASVSVSTWGGAFSSDFPVTSEEKRNKGLTRFTLGGGGASIELESFQGRIRVVRPENFEKVLRERTDQPRARDDRDDPGDPEE